MKYFVLGATGLVILMGIVMLKTIHGGLWGMHASIILSESMQPSLPRGSLVVMRQVGAGGYAVGDVVTFRMPFKPTVMITHRITAINQGETKEYGVKTKGDANINGDAWTISVGNIVGKKLFYIPWLGYGVQFLENPAVFIVMIVISFVYVILPEIFAFVALCRTVRTTTD